LAKRTVEKTVDRERGEDETEKLDDPVRHRGKVARILHLLFVHPASFLSWALLWVWENRWRLGNFAARRVALFHRIDQSATEVTYDRIDKPVWHFWRGWNKGHEQSLSVFSWTAALRRTVGTE
jgi:hypothetical protein